MTPVVGDRCVGKVKAAEVGRSFESDEAHPALHTFAQQTHQPSWSELSGKEPWHLAPASSMQLKIEACSAASICTCVTVVCVWPVRGVTIGQQRRQTVWGHMWLLLSRLSCLSTRNKCWAVYVPDPFCHYCCFSPVRCFLSVPGQWFSGEWTVFGFWFLVVFQWKFLWEPGEVSVFVGQVGNCKGQVRTGGERTKYMLTTWMSIGANCTVRQEKKRPICIERGEQRHRVNIKNICD